MSGYFSANPKQHTRVTAPIVNTGSDTEPILGISAATTGAAGSLSAADKAKLDAFYATLPIARVFHNANQSIATATLTALAFNSETYDTHAFHNTAVNNSRLTVPTGLDGVYIATAMIIWDLGATGDRFLGIRLNGSAILARLLWGAEAANNNDQMTVSTPPFRLAATDYLEAVVIQGSGAALNVLGTAGNEPHLGWVRLGGS